MRLLDHIGGNPHAVDNRALGAVLIAWLEQRSEGNGWVCWVFTSDGKMHVRPSIVLPGRPEPRRPNGDQQELARRLCIRLNREANLGGAWVMSWYGDRILAATWKDRDGDIGYNHELEDAWQRIAEMTDQEHLDSIARCVLATNELLRPLDVRRHETYRYALGERAPSGNDTIRPSRGPSRL